MSDLGLVQHARTPCHPHSTGVLKSPVRPSGSCCHQYLENANGKQQSNSSGAHSQALTRVSLSQAPPAPPPPISARGDPGWAHALHGPHEPAEPARSCAGSTRHPRHQRGTWAHWAAASFHVDGLDAGQRGAADGGAERLALQAVAVRAAVYVPPLLVGVRLPAEVAHRLPRGRVF